MKRLWCILFIIVCIAPTFAAPPKNTPKFIAVDIGPKHPALDEALYPDIKIVYLADFQVQITQDKVEYNNPKAKVTWSGTGPIADWISAAGFPGYPRFKGLLFDKAGTCAGEAWLQQSFKSGNEEKMKIQNASITFGDKKALKNALDEYVQKGKTVKENPKKQLVENKDGFIGGKLPSIPVVDGSGAQLDLATLVTEMAPVMVVFFTVPIDAPNAEVSIAAMKQETQSAATNAPTATSFVGSMLKAAVSDRSTYTMMLDQIELDFFGYLVNKAK